MQLCHTVAGFYDQLRKSFLKSLIHFGFIFVNSASVG